jgi:hypothetical protein
MPHPGYFPPPRPSTTLLPTRTEVAHHIPTVPILNWTGKVPQTMPPGGYPSRKKKKSSVSNTGSDATDATDTSGHAPKSAPKSKRHSGAQKHAQPFKNGGHVSSSGGRGGGTGQPWMGGAGAGDRHAGGHRSGAGGEGEREGGGDGGDVAGGVDVRRRATAWVVGQESRGQWIWAEGEDEELIMDHILEEKFYH